MKLIKSKDFNPNYLAKIVNITEFTKHPNPDCTGLKCFRFLVKESKAQDKGESNIEDNA